MGIWKRLQGTLRRREVEARLDSELEFHLDMLAEKFVAEDGLNEHEARNKARRQLGSTTKLREQGREADLFTTLENCARDVRQSIRGHRKRPVFAITTVSLLAIGIGCVSALFSVADAVIWTPIAWTNSSELVSVDETKDGRKVGSNGPRLQDWQGARSFAAATGMYRESLVWKSPQGVGGEPVLVVRTYSGMMAVAQPAMALGRKFTIDEERQGAPVALVTYDFWRSRLNGAPDLDHQILELSGKAYPVVGVLAADVSYPDRAGVWIPATMGLQQGPRAAGYLDVVARLKSGVSMQQAAAELDTIASRLRTEYKKTDSGLRVSLSPLTAHVAGEARSQLLVILAIAVTVLLMICVNIAALLLSSGIEREREGAMRAALGAGVLALLRLHLIETLILAFAGGMFGLVLANGAVDFLKVVLPSGTPRLLDARMDWRVVAVAAAASVLSALIAGLVPAWMAARRATLLQDARGSVSSRNRRRLRTILAVVEIGLSVLLVSTATRLGEAFLEMTRRPLPFRTSDIVAIDVPFPWSTNEGTLYAFVNRTLPMLKALPGVTGAGFIDQLPLHGGTQDNDFIPLGVADVTPVHAGFRSATSGYFTTMSIPLLAGRLFEDRARKELVVNRTFALRYLGGEAGALGRRISPGKNGSPYEVVGVVADVPQDPSRPGSDPEAYAYFENSFWAPLHFVIRTTTPVGILAPLIRREVGMLNPTVAVRSVLPMTSEIGAASEDSRTRTQLIAGFAALALLLMAIGVHGLIASDISSRWREFGVRLVMGATAGSIRTLVLRKMATLLLAGFGLGVVAVFATSGLVESSLDGIAPPRMVTAVLVLAAIVFAAGSAIVWPLLRLRRIDPAVALRHD